MKTITVKPYNPNYKSEWDAFCKQTKNATFLFQRDFMEYHADRFSDFSLCVFEGDKLAALLPAHKIDDTLYSHKGLTYGGMVTSKKIKLQKFLSIFETVLKFLNAEGISTLELKLLPKFYQNPVSEEINYALFLTEAKRVACETASAIDLHNKLPIQSNRLQGVKKAEKLGLHLEETSDFEDFWNTLLIPTLKSLGSTPVHSLEEIELLATRFPKHIKQFNVYNNDRLVAGSTIFESESVAHTQYIASNDNRQTLGSVDFLMQHLITERFSEKSYFSFGTSNTEHGKQLNKGLNYWKESFGARTFVHETFRINPAKYSRLKSVLE